LSGFGKTQVIFLRIRFLITPIYNNRPYTLITASSSEESLVKITFQGSLFCSLSGYVTHTSTARRGEKVPLGIWGSEIEFSISIIKENRAFGDVEKIDHISPAQLLSESTRNKIV
jgi:hypothetical protein